MKAVPDMLKKTRTKRTHGLLVGLLLLAGCSTPPPRPAPSVPEESTPVIAKSPTPPPPLNVATTPEVSAVASPEEKSSPAPAAVDEDNNVFFDRGATTINEKEKEKLREHANRLKQNPKKYVTLTGYADDLGSRNYKLAIAEERLVAVNKVLQSYGVSPRQIRRNRSASVKNSPACKKADCLRLKRRVELVYSK